MKYIHKAIFSHKSRSFLEQKVGILMENGWDCVKQIYQSSDGHFNVEMEISQYVTIYCSITDVLYPGDDEKQKFALCLYKNGQFENIKFISSSVKNLIGILDENGGRLRVHSSWRYRIIGDPEMMTNLFKNNGFKSHHLHNDFFVRPKGLTGYMKDRDINFSNSDDSFINIVIDKDKNLKLGDDFILYNPVNIKEGLSITDVENIKGLIKERLDNLFLRLD